MTCLLIFFYGCASLVFIKSNATCYGFQGSDLIDEDWFKVFVSVSYASAGTVGAAQAVPDQSKGRKTGHRQTDESKMVKGDAVEDGEGSSRAAPTDEPSYACSGENKRTYSQQKTTLVETVVETEISSQNIIQVRPSYSSFCLSYFHLLLHSLFPLSAN